MGAGVNSCLLCNSCELQVDDEPVMVAVTAVV